MGDDLGMAALTGTGASAQRPSPKLAEAGDKGSESGFVVPSQDTGGDAAKPQTRLCAVRTMLSLPPPWL